jgi:hypothetical protein
VSLRNCLILLLAALALGAATLIPTLASPTPQNQSRFIRSYDPMPVVKSFRAACSSHGNLVDQFTETLTTREDSAGSIPRLGSPKDVEHHLTVEPHYCGNPDSNAALLTALQQHAIAALRNAHCSVSGDSLTLESGLRIGYACGTRTTGIVTAGPPLAKNADDPSHLVLSVKVDERWAVRRD